MIQASFALTWFDVMIAMIPLAALLFAYLGRKIKVAKVFSWILHAAPVVGVLVIVVIYALRTPS